MTHKRVEAERSRGDATGAGQPAVAPVPLRRRMRRWSYHRLVRLMMLVHNTVLFLAKRLGPSPTRTSLQRRGPITRVPTRGDWFGYDSTPTHTRP